MKRKIMVAGVIFLLLASPLTIYNSNGIEINKKVTVSNDEPIIDWEENFGGNLRDYGMDIIKTNDNGYLAVGNYEEGSKGWIIKLDSQGQVVWDKKYGLSSTNYFRRIIQTDNGYILGGSSDSEIDSDRELWLVKIYNDGNVEWSEKYGYQNSLDLFLDFSKSADNGYILLGSTLEGNDLKNPLIIKLNNNGEEQKRIIYDRYIDDTSEDIHLFDVDLTSDNCYILSGYIQKPYLSDYDFFLLKLDNDLNEIWNHTFDSGTSFDFSYDVCETYDGYIMVGDYYYETFGTPHTGAWIVKSDKNGNKIWDEKYQGINNHASPFYIEKLRDNNFILTGETGQIFDNFHKDLWILKIDGLGNKIWSTTHGYEYSDDGSAIIETDDQGIIAIGTTMTEYNQYNFNQDMWVLKFSYESNGYKPKKPRGETRGITGEEYTYTTSVNHPDGNNVQYGWSWGGDNFVDEWTDFYESGEEISTSHTWNHDGGYFVKVIARDQDNFESEWSDTLSVTMPKNKIYKNSLLNLIFKIFKNLDLEIF